MDLVSKPKVKSAIWVHFGFKPNEKGEPQNIDEAVCRLCRRIVFVKGGNTSNLRHHLRLRHPDIFSEFISATSGHGYYFEPSGSEQSQHYNNDNGSQGNFGSGHGNFGSGHGNFGVGHGNDRLLHFIPDTVVCGEPWLEGGDPRAVGSIPPCLSLRRWGSGPVSGGSAEEEEAGVFAKTLSLHQGWTFGPFVGELTRGPLSCLKYAWAIKENDSYYFVDASDENKSNWMRYVACAACEEEHNLTVFQYRGQIFYRVSQPIPEGTELKVWIGQEYAAMLGLGIGENIKCEFGDKEILLRIFRDIQVVPVGGTSSLPDTNGSYSWSDNSQSGSPLPVISDVSSGLQTDTTDPTPVLNPPQNTNQTGLATTVKYDFVKGAEILLSPSQPNSPVWEFFGFEPDPNGQPLDKDKVMCKLCGQHVDYSATVTHLENHLVQMHHMKRRDVIKDGNKPWVSSSRFRPYHSTGGRAPRSSSPSTHRTTNNYSNEDWTWSGNGSSAVTDTVTAGLTATPGQRTLSNFLTNQTTTAITNFLIKDLLPPDTVEGEGFKQLIQNLLPSCQEIPSASLLEEVLRDVHTKGRKNWAKLLTNSTGFNEDDTSKPNIPVQFKPSSSTRKAARFCSQTQNQVSHHVAVSADVWCHDWQGDQERYATVWAHFINADFTSHNLALATQRLGETGTGDMDLSMVEATVRSMAQEWDISQPSFILLGGDEMEKTKVGPKKRERTGEGVGGGARPHHPNSTTFLEMEDSISSDDLSGLERAIERANSTSEESHSPPIPCFFTAVQSCIEEVMGHSIISKTLSVFQHLLYSLFSLHDKDMVTLHPARKLISVLQKQETAELKAWAYGKPGWNGLYSVVKTLLRYQNMISETLKQIDSEIQTGQDTGSPTDLDSGATAALKTADKHGTNSTSAACANSDTTDSSNSSVPVPPKRSDWKVLEDLSSMLKPLDVACRTLAKELFPRLSLVKPILTGLLDRHFAPHPRHRNDSTILKELKKKIRWGLSCRYNDPQINQVLCVACALDPQFHGLGFMDVREQATTFAWLKKEAVRIVEEDRRRADAASPGGKKRKKRGSSSTTSSSGDMEGDVLRRSKRLKEITPVSFKERTESDSDEEATGSSVNDDSETDNMELKLEPASQQTGMEFLLGDLFGSQSQNKQPSVEETVDIELSVFRAEKGATLGVEPLQWWKARSGQLPLLAKVARAYLAAPAVAGSAVQMFLQDGGGVIQRKRTNIPPEGLDQMLFLHHNGLTTTTQGYTTV